jgi:hypothetical protein
MVEQAIEDVLSRASRRDLVVQEDEELVVDVEAERFRNTVQQVMIRGFKDLQTLHLIPGALEEGLVRDAIAADDTIAFEAARRHVETHRDVPCACSAGAPHEAMRTDYQTAFRRAYGDVRKHQNHNLAQVCSKATRQPTQWDSLDVAIIRGWVDKVSKISIPFILILLADVEVMKNATLTLAPNAKYLSGNALKIHTGGKVVAKGSGVKLWFKSAHGNLA